MKLPAWLNDDEWDVDWAYGMGCLAILVVYVLIFVAVFKLIKFVWYL